MHKRLICVKGAAGISQITAPSRLTGPIRRIDPRGSGAFEAIGCDEARALAVQRMRPLNGPAPEMLAFFTGCDQSLTCFRAQSFGTPNDAAHGGFGPLDRAAARIDTIDGVFREWGQPDLACTKLFILSGVAEDHDSNPIRCGIGRLKTRG